MAILPLSLSSHLRFSGPPWSPNPANDENLWKGCKNAGAQAPTPGRGPLQESHSPRLGSRQLYFPEPSRGSLHHWRLNSGARDIQDLKTGFSKSLFFFDFIVPKRKLNSFTPATPQPFTFIPPLLQRTKWSVPTAAPDKTTSLPALAVPSGNKLNSILHGSLPFL